MLAVSPDWFKVSLNQPIDVRVRFPDDRCPPARAQMRADEFGDFGVGATAEEVADLDHVESVGPIPSRPYRVGHTESVTPSCPSASRGCLT